MAAAAGRAGGARRAAVRHAAAPRTALLLLVRRGGFSVGLARDGALLDHSTGTRYVQGRTAAGGWSQQRFARRRSGQADALVGACADTVAAVLARAGPTPPVLVPGGDRRLLADVLADPRLAAADGAAPGPAARRPRAPTGGAAAGRRAGARRPGARRGALSPPAGGAVGARAAGWPAMTTEDTLPVGADDAPRARHRPRPELYTKKGRLRSEVYEEEIERLQEQLVKLQYWIAAQGLEVLVIFEGRGSAGKGGVIKRITERTSPRIVRVVALPKPTERAADPVVLPALRRAPARGRRDGDVRPQLVQPLERRVGDGLLHRGGAPGVPALLPGVRADAGPLRDHRRSSTGSR